MLGDKMENARSQVTNGDRIDVSGRELDERHAGTAERQGYGGHAPILPSRGEIVLDAWGGLDSSAGRRASRSRMLFWILTLAFILLFWIGQWAAVTVIRLATMPGEGTTYVWARAG